MAANITLTNLVLASNGKTLTATLSGGTGTGYAITDSTGITVTTRGLTSIITSVSVLGTTLTTTLSFPIGSTDSPAPALSVSTGSNITDSGDNTVASGQTAISVTNNSTKVVVAFASNNSAFHFIGNFTQEGAPLLLSTEGASGGRFAATGTDVAIVAQIGSTSYLSATVDGGASPTNYVVSSQLPQCIGENLSDSTHEYQFALFGYLDDGIRSGTHGTILVAGSAPALVAPSGDWGTRYFFDSAPFTTYGKFDTTTSLTSANGSHLDYNIPGHQGFRVRSDSPFIAIWAYPTGDTGMTVFQDGIAIEEVTFSGAGVRQRIVLKNGLSGTHTYEVLQHSPMFDIGTVQTYVLYVELGGSGIMDGGLEDRAISSNYGDSITGYTAGGVTDCKDGDAFIATEGLGYTVSIVASGGGSVHLVGLYNTDKIPANSLEVWVKFGVNDKFQGVDLSTFEDEYGEMVDLIRTRIGLGKNIYCRAILEFRTGIDDGRSDYNAAIVAAVDGKPDVIFIPTDGWVTLDTDHFASGDNVHINALGYAQTGNRMKPIEAESAIAITGPSVGSTGQTSSNFTVTLGGGATFAGDQTITLTSTDTGDTLTPSVGSPGTGSVSVTPIAGATSFTFTTTPATDGVHAITPTTTQAGWTMPEGAEITVNDSTVTGVSVSPSSPILYGGATQQFSFTVEGEDGPSQDVTWEATGGSINSSGLFTAPGGLASGPQSITVTATSDQDDRFFDAANVTVPAHTANGGGSSSSGTQLGTEGLSS